MKGEKDLEFIKELCLKLRDVVVFCLYITSI